MLLTDSEPNVESHCGQIESTCINSEYMAIKNLSRKRVRNDDLYVGNGVPCLKSQSTNFLCTIITFMSSEYKGAGKQQYDANAGLYRFLAINWPLSTLSSYLSLQYDIDQ